VVQYWPVTVHISGSAPEKDLSIRMPFKDKKRLDYFFREVCFLQTWAYTLLGSKPMSTHQYRKPWAAVRSLTHHPHLKDILLGCFWPPRFQEIRYLFTPEQLKIKLGWNTLNKYIHNFPNSRFVLHTYCFEDTEVVVFALIDKIKFIKMIKHHREDFQGALQIQAIEPDALLDNENLYQFIKNLTHEGLIGTVLGFGRDNAWLFHKYHHKMDSKDNPMVSMWLDEEGVNLEQLNKKTLSFEPWGLSDLFYPRCACDPQLEETKQLKRTYQEEREKIIHYYEGKDVVEATLSLFIGS